MKGGLLLSFTAIFSLAAAATRQGCLPGCECGRAGNNGKGSSGQYRVITCDKFPSNSIPTGFSTLQVKVSPKNLTRSTFAPINPTYITTLDLCESGIQSLEDNALAIFQRLAILKLSLNKIKTVTSSAFSGCNQLLAIYLDGNGLTSLGPNCFTGLSKLTNLYIQHNNIKQIPPLPPSLYYLDASYNSIGPEINDYVFQEKVRYVDLCGNPITSVEASCFSKTALQSLCTPGRLEPQENGKGYSLNLNNITLVANPPGTILPPHLVQQLVNMEELQHITITSYNVSSMEFLNSKVLLTLVLEHVGAMGSSPKELVDSLSKQAYLEKLSLAYSPQLASALANDVSIWQHLTRLQTLDLKGCRLQSLHNIQGHGIPMYVDLSDNPLHCDCKLLGALGVDLLLCDEGAQAMCATPDIYKGQPLVKAHSQLCDEQPSPNSFAPNNKVDESNGPDNTNDNANPNTNENPEPPNKEDVQPQGGNSNEEDHFNPESPIERNDEEYPEENNPPPEEESPNGNSEHAENPHSNGQVSFPEERPTGEDDENKSPTPEPSLEENPYGHHMTTEHPSTFKEFDDKYVEQHPEGESKKTLVITILGVVVALAVIAAVVFSVLFFYFRRRGHMGIEGTAHAQYSSRGTNSKDNLVK